MAKAILDMKKVDIERYKVNSHKAASVLCYENESKEFQVTVKKLLSKSEK